MSERLRQITDEPQSLEGYFKTEDRYNTFTPGLKRLVRRIDQEEGELDIDEKLIVFSYLFWRQTPDCVLIAHCLGEEEEEIEERVSRIIHSPDEDCVFEATCRLIDRVPSGSPFKGKHPSISPELREEIIKLRKQGTPNREIADILGLKENRLDYILHILLKEGEIESKWKKRR